jgi:SAM-dependent methyltransferase
MRCRFCGTQLRDLFLDLGSAPPSNAFLTAAELNAPEVYFPLRLFTCPDCHLVQVDEWQKHDELFSSSYVYFSSYSQSWLAHAAAYVEFVSQRLGLDEHSLVMEVASNDGYLLQYVKARGIPCIGIEPTASTAAAARERGIETLQRFFGRNFALEFIADGRNVDLLVANNVLAHVPDINDFVAGLATVLAADGVLTVEFPHLLQLVAQRQFDTVYHEHFSYFSLHTVQRIFAAHGLRIWDVNELPTHGGSLRLWASRIEAKHRQTPAVASLLAKEADAGMTSMEYYQGFQGSADTIKNDFLAFLLECKRAGKRVVGYGAAAKGNTLMNYAGIKPDLLPFVADASPHKQGLFLPGTHIPVVSEARIRDFEPDFVVVLPWNLLEEIAGQLDYIRQWGGKFVTTVPAMVVS